MIEERKEFPNVSKRHKLSKLNKEERRAWKFYQDWRKSGSQSPAFQNETIYITRLGWDHLVNPRKHRTKAEKVRRFKALPIARKILEVSTTYQEHREDNGISYWAFIATMSGQQVKVVVSARNKKKYFLSVIVMR